MKWRFDYLLILFLILLAVLPASAQVSSGQLAVMGNDGNIYTYDISTQTLTPVTSDADLSRKGRTYSWPTWSTDGQLAYFGASQEAQNSFGLGIFIKPVGRDPKGVFSAPDDFFTYAHWSPADCPDGGAGCRDLMVLYTGENGLATRMIRSDAEFTVTEIDAGQPFYWDWSPTGDSMLWARFGLSFEMYDVAAHEVTETLAYQQGLVNTVDWSPVDDRLLLGIATASGDTAIIVAEGDKEQVLVEGLNSGAAFEWSPTGEQVAYLDWADGSLHIVDARTGAAVSTVSDGVVSFFWSPDGAKIAYLTLDDGKVNPGAKVMGQALPALRWQVYELASDSSRLFNSFVPSQNMLYYLGFFDQFARSHRLWSPDSRYLVYGEQTTTGNAVTIIDTTASNLTPITIPEGNMAVFSWN